MKKRWLIRSFCIGLLMVCVGAWVGSYSWFVSIRHCAGGRSQVLMVDGGKVIVSAYDSQIQPLTWQWDQGIHTVDWYEHSYPGTKHRFAGFAYAFTSNASTTDWQAFIPLWFPTLLSALVLWFVWKKTRPRSTGFPVEPDKKSADSK